MFEFYRGKKNRSKNTLFNPYTNGISSYDMTYLSSKKKFHKSKIIHIQDDPKKEYNAA